MRTLFVLCVVLSLTGCSYIYASPSPGPPPPSYIYAYPDGCWADGFWYEPCPWDVGPQFGYYHYQSGYFYYQPERQWPRHRMKGPPGYWVRDRPGPEHRVHKPRVRDHRPTPTPRTRDHRPPRPRRPH